MAAWPAFLASLRTNMPNRVLCWLNDGEEEPIVHESGDVPFDVAAGGEIGPVALLAALPLQSSPGSLQTRSRAPTAMTGIGVAADGIAGVITDMQARVAASIATATDASSGQAKITQHGEQDRLTAGAGARTHWRSRRLRPCRLTLTRIIIARVDPMI